MADIDFSNHAVVNPEQYSRPKEVGDVGTASFAIPGVDKAPAVQTFELRGYLGYDRRPCERLVAFYDIVNVGKMQLLFDRNKKKNQPAARQRTAYDLPIYDTYNQAEASTGVPKSVLMWAQKQKSPGFLSQCRVDMRLFLEWFFTTQMEGGEKDWGNHKKKFDALLAQKTYENKANMLYSRQEVDAFVIELVSLFFSEMERMQQEYPALLKGKEEVEICQDIEADVVHFTEVLDNKLTKWESEHKIEEKKDEITAWTDTESHKREPEK